MKQERAKVTRAELLQAAGEAFSQLTYSDAKLTDVLAHTRAGKGALYFHFSSKQELAVAVIQTGQEQLSEVAARVVAGPGAPRQKLLELFEGISQLLVSSEMARGALSLSTQRAPELMEIAVDPVELWGPIVRDLLSAAHDEGQLADGVSLDSLTLIIVSCFMGVRELCALRNDFQGLPGKVAEVLGGVLATSFK